MKKHLYLILNILIPLGPLAFVWEPEIGFYRHGLAAAGAILSSGLLYVVWDILATRHGDWNFNPVYVEKKRFFGLPFGELLFFAGVPFACLFLFEVTRHFFIQDQLFEVSRFFLLCGAAAFITAAYLFRRHNYSLLVCLSVAAFMTTLAVDRSYLLGNATVLIWLGFCFAAFLIFNGIFTALPIVRYNPKAILGFRVFTIPVEDFFYNFSYLGFTLHFYLLYQQFGA